MSGMTGSSNSNTTAEAPVDADEQGRPRHDGEDAVDGLGHLVGQGALDPLEVGGEAGEEVAGAGSRVEADRQALQVREDPEAEVAHHARHHPRDEVVVGEVAEPVQEEEPDHRRDELRGQGGVAGHDGVVEERPQEEGLEGDEGGGRRLGEDDEEGLPPVGPEVAGRRAQERRASRGILARREF